MNPQVEIGHAITRFDARIALFEAIDKGEPLEPVVDLYANSMDSIVPQSVRRWAERTRRRPAEIAHATLATIFERDQAIAERFRDQRKLSKLIGHERAQVTRLRATETAA